MRGYSEPTQRLPCAANRYKTGIIRGKQKNILQIGVFVETILSKGGIFFINVVFFPNKSDKRRKIFFYWVASVSGSVRVGCVVKG